MCWGVWRWTHLLECRWANRKPWRAQRWPPSGRASGSPYCCRWLCRLHGTAKTNRHTYYNFTFGLERINIFTLFLLYFLSRVCPAFCRLIMYGTLINLPHLNQYTFYDPLIDICNYCFPNMNICIHMLWLLMLCFRLKKRKVSLSLSKWANLSWKPWRCCSCSFHF